MLKERQGSRRRRLRKESLRRNAPPARKERLCLEARFMGNFMDAPNIQNASILRDWWMGLLKRILRRRKRIKIKFLNLDLWLLLRFNIVGFKICHAVVNQNSYRSYRQKHINNAE